MSMSSNLGVLRKSSFEKYADISDLSKAHEYIAELEELLAYRFNIGFLLKKNVPIRRY